MPLIAVSDTITGGPLLASPEASGAQPPMEAVDIGHALSDVRKMVEFKPRPPGLLEQWLKNPQVKAITDRLDAWLERILDAVREAMASITPPPLKHLTSDLLDMFNGVIGFLLVLLALYAFYLLLGYLLRLRESRPLPPSPANREFDASRLLSFKLHRTHAERLSQKGNYGEAIRQLYLATLCLLDESRLVPFETTRTNAEYARALGGDLRDSFRQLARSFEAVRYGNARADAGHYGQCETGLHQLAQSLPPSGGGSRHA